MKSLNLAAGIATALILSVTSASAAPVKHTQRMPLVVPMPPEKPLILADNGSKSAATPSETSASDGLQSPVAK